MNKDTKTRVNVYSDCPHKDCFANVKEKCTCLKKLEVCFPCSFYKEDADGSIKRKIERDCRIYYDEHTEPFEKYNREYVKEKKKKGVNYEK